MNNSQMTTSVRTVLQPVFERAMMQAVMSVSNEVWTMYNSPQDSDIRQQTATQVLQRVEARIKESVLKLQAEALNGLFTSDALREVVGWGSGPITLGPQFAQSQANAWTKSTSKPSPLLLGLKMVESIEKDVPSVGTEIYGNIINFTTLPSSFGDVPQILPKRQTNSVLLTKEEAKEIADMHPRKNTLKDIRKADWVLPAVRRKMEVLIQPPNGHLHIAYTFWDGLVHHGVLLKDQRVVEVANRVFKPSTSDNRIVRSIITVSSLGSFISRAAGNDSAVYVVNYSNPFPGDLVAARAEWALGKWEYNLIYQNCESVASWIVSNNFYSEQCERYKAMDYSRVKSTMTAGSKKKKDNKNPAK